MRPTSSLVGQRRSWPAVLPASAFHTALAATVGDDVFGGFVRDELAAAGVDTRDRTDPNVPTGVTVVLLQVTGQYLTYPGTLAATGPEVVDADQLTGVRHVHSASMFLQPNLSPHLPGLFLRARAGGATTSLDTNWDPAERWTEALPLLEHVDVLFPNSAELLALTGLPDLDKRRPPCCRDGLRGGVEERRGRRNARDRNRPRDHRAGAGRGRRRHDGGRRTL